MYHLPQARLCVHILNPAGAPDICILLHVYLHGCLDEEAKSELRKLIREHLTEELKKLRVSVDEQIKASEDAITNRLQSADAPTSGKTKKK